MVESACFLGRLVQAVGGRRLMGRGWVGLGVGVGL